MKSPSIIGLLVFCATVSALADSAVAESWGSYDAHKAPLNVEVVTQRETDKRHFQLIHYAPLIRQRTCSKAVRI